MTSLITDALLIGTVDASCTRDDALYHEVKANLALSGLVWGISAVGAARAFDCEFPSERRTSIGFACTCVALSALGSLAVNAHTLHACIHAQQLPTFHVLVDVVLQVGLLGVAAAFVWHARS